MEKRIVKVGAADKRYHKGEYYWALPVEDTRAGIYITGQEKSKEKPNGLTMRQIKGEVPLTEAQVAELEYPIILNDETFRGIAISKHTQFDLSKDDSGAYVNKTDVTKYEFFMKGQAHVVASSLKAVIPNTHLFYFIYDIDDAAERNSRRKLVLKANEMVTKNLDASSYYELLIYVNYIRNLSYDTNSVNEEVMLDKIFQICDLHPETVLNLFTEKGADDLFILKLLYHDIISFRDGSFVNKDDKYLGNTPADVNKYLSQKGNHLVAISWRKSLQAKDKRFAEYSEKVNAGKGKDSEQ